jgi:hypothetical protein
VKYVTTMIDMWVITFVVGAASGLWWPWILCNVYLVGMPASKLYNMSSE